MRVPSPVNGGGSVRLLHYRSGNNGRQRVDDTTIDGAQTVGKQCGRRFPLPDLDLFGKGSNDGLESLRVESSRTLPLASRAKASCCPAFSGLWTVRWLRQSRAGWRQPG